MLQKAKALVAAVVVVGFLAGSVPAQAMARDHDRERRCEQRIRKAEINLQNAIRKHGERSHQAEKRRHQLEEAREHCRYDRYHR
jgi:hypothetical protein